VATVADAIGGRNDVVGSADHGTVDPLVDAVVADLGAIDVDVVDTGCWRASTRSLA
jgi:hypothetical protein